MGTLLSVIAGLATVKIIALWVPREQYGEASLALGISVLLNNLLIGPLMAAHLRVYFDYRERGAGEWFTKYFFRVCLGASGLCALLYLLIAFGFWASGSPMLLRLAIPAMLLIGLQPFLSVMLNYLEAERFYFGLALANMGQKVLQVPSMILLLATTISAAGAVILSQAAAIVPILLVARKALALQGRVAVATKPPATGDLTGLIRAFSAFGLSLPLGYLIHWVLSTSDRYLIAHFMATQDVGVYAMNYAFWSIPYLLLGGWLETLTRPRVYERASRGDWQGVRIILMRRVGLTLGLGLLGSAALLVIGQPLSSYMLGPSYRTDWTVSASIAGAHLFLILGYAASPIFLATKRTQVILYATGAAAILNIGLNLWTIPRLGILGAALSTAAAYLLWAIVIVVGALRHSAALCCSSSMIEGVSASTP